MRWLLVVAVIAGCGGPGLGGPRFLGAPVPAACREGAFEPCLAALGTLQAAARLNLTEAPEVRAYVQRVADRLARHTRMGRAPRVLIEEIGTRAYVTLGARFVIVRNMLGWVGSEAELAALLAHELAHIEGDHANLATARFIKDERWYAARRDAEAVADERAVELLARAGYPAVTMARLYERTWREHGEPFNDHEHPALETSLPRLRALAAGRTGGVEGRAELLRQTAGLIVGRDPRSGARVGKAWVIPRLGLAVAIPGEIEQSSSSHRVWTSLPEPHAFDLTSRAWARELARALDDRRTRRSAAGPVTVGVMPTLPVRDHEPVALALDSWRDQVARPPAGSVVMIVERAEGALVFELPPLASSATIDAVLSGLRAPTRGELAAAVPVRIRLAIASRTGTIRELVKSCVDPAAALGLDDAERVVAKGEPFKCTDRVAPD